MITSARSQKILSKTISISLGSMRWYLSGKKQWRWFWMLSLVRFLPCLRWLRSSPVFLTMFQMKTRQKSLMFQLSKHQQNCCMGLCTNVTYLRELDSTRWSVNPLTHYCSRNYEPKYFQAEKYEAGIFGSCPRVYCMGCNVVPCGRSDLPGLETVKLFCPNCNDIYVPASSRFQGVDGVSPSASAKYSVFLTGVGFLTRRFFWHHIRTSLFPDLSRTYARSVLEAAIFVRFYVAVSVTAQRDGQQLFSTGAVRQSQPPWWPKTCRGESICPPNLRV